jgi:hypothetical protein
MIAVNEVIEKVRISHLTLLVVDDKGGVRNCIALDKEGLYSEENYRLLKMGKIRGCAVNLIPQDENITEAKIMNKIKEMVDSLNSQK